ncbi:MAG: hypothetical protein ABGW97_07910 [Christiangramia sp.]|uniref:hypothetical protein n=1 Tax=Christiangramia sp. TaxID=1931228 RepID=UPI0032428585
MKTLFFSLLLLASISLCQAQEIVLDEAKVGFAPLDAKITRDGDQFTYKVNEAYQGQFAKNPIAFMEENFDIQNFIHENEGRNYDSYQVTFRSGNGALKADFDKDGTLVKTYQRFKNSVMPLNVRRMVYANYQGWTVKEHVYVASGKQNLIDKEVYKLKMQKGNERQRVKLNPRAQGVVSMASN